jgi:hypothetical protein
VERLANGGDLGHGSVQRPERRVVRPIRSAAAELVVEDDHPLIGQVSQGVDVVVRHARPAVQGEERDAGRAIAHGLVPDLAAGDLDGAFHRSHGSRAPMCAERS